MSFIMKNTYSHTCQVATSSMFASKFHYIRTPSDTSDKTSGNYLLCSRIHEGVFLFIHACSLTAPRCCSTWTDLRTISCYLWFLFIQRYCLAKYRSVRFLLCTERFCREAISSSDLSLVKRFIGSGHNCKKDNSKMTYDTSWDQSILNKFWYIFVLDHPNNLNNLVSKNHQTSVLNLKNFKVQLLPIQLTKRR